MLPRTMLHECMSARCRSLFFMRLVYLIWALLLLCTAISALSVAALAAYVAAQVPPTVRTSV